MRWRSTRWRRDGWLVSVVLLCALWPQRGRAENADLLRARTAYNDMQYEQAEQAFRAALASSGNRPADLVDIYLHLGIIAASTNRKSEAIDSFVNMLCVDPEPTLSEEIPPKVQRRLDEARRKAKQITRFSVVHEPVRTLARGGGLEVTAAVTADSLGLAKGLALRYRLAGTRSYQVVSKELAASVAFAIPPAEVPPGKDVEYLLQLTDQHGGALLEVGTELAPLRARSPVPPAVAQIGAPGAGRSAAKTAATGTDGGLLAQPWFFIAAGAGAVALLAGGATAAAVAWVVTEPKQARFGQVSQEISQVR